MCSNESSPLSKCGTSSSHDEGGCEHGIGKVLGGYLENDEMDATAAVVLGEGVG